MFVKGAVVVDTFVHAEMFSVFDRLESMVAVRALEFQMGCYLFSIHKGLTADFAFKLTASTGIIIDVLMWSPAERAGGISRDGTCFALLGLYRRNCFTVAETIILVPKLPVLFDKGFDDREFVRGKFLVGRAVDLIMSPLFQRDISADEENKPANLLILFLNDSE